MFTLDLSILSTLIEEPGTAYLTDKAAYVVLDNELYTIPGNFSEMTVGEFNEYILTHTWN